MNEYGNHRQIWVKANRPIPKDEFRRSYHIHHLDRDPTNNELDNLICLSANVHYELHKTQVILEQRFFY